MGETQAYTMALLLASNSPRRRELLKQITPNFRIEPSLFEESAKGLSAHETALLFARGKAAEVLSRFPQDVALGADTVVSLGEQILGKPRSAEEAKHMLRVLSGKEHAVYTGVALLGGEKALSLVVRTAVFFRPLTEKTIEEYVATGSPLDKAGAYGIQDGFGLVEKIEGSYSNVVGLPVEETRALLIEHGGIIC